MRARIGAFRAYLRAAVAPSSTATRRLFSTIVIPAGRVNLDVIVQPDRTIQ
jgi:hypothetical protein